MPDKVMVPLSELREVEERLKNYVAAHPSIPSTDLLECPFCGSPAETRADTSKGSLEEALVAEPMAKCSQHGCGARFIVMSVSEWNTRHSNADPHASGVSAANDR